MKYIILAITLLFSSCGIKNKITKWNTSGELGIRKQNSIVAEANPTSLDAVDAVDAVDVVDGNESKVHETYYQSESSEQSTSDNNSFWFYVVPFVGLAVIALLVLRLKKQNMKSL